MAPRELLLPRDEPDRSERAAERGGAGVRVHQLRGQQGGEAAEAGAGLRPGPLRGDPAPVRGQPGSIFSRSIKLTLEL